MKNPPPSDNRQCELFTIAGNASARGVPHVLPDAPLDLHKKVLHAKVIPEPATRYRGDFAQERDVGKFQLTGEFIL